MNERIKELKHQALVFAQEKCNGQPQDLNGVPRSDIMTEKFAELIVRECISELEEMKRSGVPIPIQGGLNLGVVALKLHFGVEE